MTVEAASTDKFVPFRGAIRAVAADGHALFFVTVHPEGQATPLYRLDVDKADLSTSALPAAAPSRSSLDEARRSTSRAPTGTSTRAPPPGGSSRRSGRSSILRRSRSRCSRAIASPRSRAPRS